MRSLSVRLIAVVAAPLLVLSACGGDDESSSSSLDDIEVTGAFGETPKVDIPDGFSADSSQTEVVSEGDGDTIGFGDKILLQVAAFNGTTGKEFANTFSGQVSQPQSMTVDKQSSLLPGLTDGIEGEKIGSRVLMSISPDDGFGEQGNSQLGIGPDDTVVALVDLLPVDPAPKANGSVDDVDVSGAPGQEPRLDFKKPLYVDGTGSKVITPGDGDVIKSGDVITADYVGVNARTGKVFDSSYAKGGQPAQFPLSTDQVPPGFVEGLVGKRLGSRVAVAMSRDDAYGPAGNEKAGVKGTDSVVFVFELRKPPPQHAATGDIDDVTVTGKYGTQPKVTFDKPLYVDETQSKVLSKGSGKPLKAGDSVTMSYVGINGRTGKEFDSNFGSAPTPFTLDDKVIPGFSKGLVGQLPGSRVLLTIPRDDGYGETGNSQAGIEGQDTLVFVIDIAKAGS